jgi:molecular chaperone DnaK (HSP70)
MMAEDQTKWVGIDLGTSTTLIATETGVLPVGSGAHLWIPSIAAVGPDGLIVGDAAQGLDPSKVLRSPKRYITENSKTGTLTSPPEGLDPLVALEELLRHVTDKARALDVEVDGTAVRLGCPAMWTGEQRKKLCDIAGAVGIEVEIGDLVEEPIAVGVSWILEQRNAGLYKSGGRVVVVDAGGGTTDVAVIQAEDSDDSLRFSVLASDAISTAGDHVDTLVSDHLRQRDSISSEEIADAELLRVSLFLKEALTSETSATSIYGSGGAREAVLTREEFDEAFSATGDKIIQFTEAVVRSAKMRERDPLPPDVIRKMDWIKIRASVDVVVLAGGTGRIPALRKALEASFGKPVVELMSPQLAVVKGLAARVDYGRINLPRPPFDFVLEYEYQGKTFSETLYKGFTPLYEWDAVFGGSPQLYKEFRVETMHRGAVKTVRVACKTPGANTEYVPLLFNEREEQPDGELGPITSSEQNYFEVVLDLNGGVKFILRPDGTVVLNHVKYGIEEWPAVRGRHNRGALPPVNVQYLKTSAKAFGDTSKD